MAILNAVETHKGDVNGTNVMIYTDSKKAVQELKRRGSLCKSVLRIKQIAKDLAALHCKLVIGWIPGHQGIPGNEEANALARAKLTKTTPGLDHDYYTDGSEEPSHDPVFVKERLQAERRERLNGLLPSDEHPIHPTFSRWAKVCLRRLQTDTAITPAVLSMFYPPNHPRHVDDKCQECGEIATSRHLIWDCVSNDGVRQAVLDTLPPAVRPRTYAEWTKPTGTPEHRKAILDSLVQYIKDTGLSRFI